MRQLTAVPPLPSSPAASLVEVDPAFARGIPPEDGPLAERALTLPLVHFPRGTCSPAQVADRTEPRRWLLITDGVLAAEAAVAGRRIVHMLGPGDVIVPEPADAEALSRMCSTSHHADTPVTAMVLGTRFATAARAWPGLSAELQERMAGQIHRLLCQSAILALPHVRDRVVAILRLLSQTWGRVRRDGVVVPLRLTHERLGRMTAARRPTVTLAMRELAEAGAVRRVPEGWLLAGSQADGWSSGTAGDQPVRRTATSDGGVSSSTLPAPGRGRRSA